MANVVTPAVNTEHITKTRKFIFTPVPTIANLPAKTNTAGDNVDVVIVTQ